MSAMTEIQTITCKQGGEGENIFDCAIRHGFDAKTYRIGGGAMGARMDGEELAGWVRTRPNDPAYPIYRRVA